MPSFLNRIKQNVSTLKAVPSQITSYLLIKASKYNQNWCVAALLSWGAAVHATDAQKNTALHYATLNNNAGLAEVLIKYGAIIQGPDARNKELQTPWSIAINQFAEGIDNLNLLGSLLGLALYTYKNTEQFHKDVATKALFKAAEAEHSSFKHLKKFIALGADVNAQNKDGNTLLHFAARNNSVIAMTTLLKNGADLNIRNNAGEQPIHFAARAHANEEYVEINGTLELLLKNGAAPNAEDFHGNTPLHNAASNSLATEDATDDPELAARLHKTFDILLDNEADATILNNIQQTPVHTAVLNNNITALKFFLERNIEFSLDRDENGNIPLHYIFKLQRTREPKIANEATMRTQNAIIEELKQYNWLEQLLTENNAGRTPLHMLIEENPPINFIKAILKSIPKEELTKLLAATDVNGNTLLHIAYEYDNSQSYKPKHRIKYVERIEKLDKNARAIADLLIKLGSNLEAKNSAGDTPVAIAAQNKTFTNLLEPSKPQDPFAAKKSLLMSPNPEQSTMPAKNGRTIVYPTPKQSI